MHLDAKAKIMTVYMRNLNCDEKTNALGTLVAKTKCIVEHNS